MVERDPASDEPSLELPKLRLRRRPPAPTQQVAVPAAGVDVPEPVAEPEPVAGTDPPGPRRERGPGGLPSATLAGLVVGLGVVGLTWASLRSCESIQGTSSCGGAGYPLLALILAVMVLVGSLLLRLARVPDPTTTSVLGVGLAVVVALLVLVDHLMDRSMVVVVPLVSAATFALAHWVTSTFIEPARD